MKKMWKNRGESGGFCEESGGADVFEGQERDGRRRGRKDGGRMEEGQREDRGEAPRKTAWNGGNEGRRVSLRA